MTCVPSRLDSKIIDMSLEELIGTTGSEELIQKIKGKLVPRKKSETGVHRVFDLEGYPDIIVKEVNIEVTEKLGYTESEFENMVIEDHKFASAYLLNYIPHTVFVRGDLGNGESLYLIQNKVYGWDDSEIDPGFMNIIDVPEAMLDKFEDFFADYRRMRNAGAAIEDQFMINPSEHKIYVVDTNTLRRPCTRDQIVALIDSLGDEPKSYEAADLLTYLQKHFKTLRGISLEDEYQFLETVQNSYEPIIDEIVKAGKKGNIVDLRDSVAYIIQSITHFPPPYFKDNYYTMKIRQKFNLPKPQ